MGRWSQDRNTAEVQVAVNICIVVWHTDINWCIFQRCRHIVVRYRRIVHGGHRYIDHRLIALAWKRRTVVAHVVPDRRNRSIEVEYWCKGHIAQVIHRKRTLPRYCVTGLNPWKSKIQVNRCRIDHTIRIRIVVRDVEGNRRVLCCRRTIVYGNRRIVHRSNGYINVCNVAQRRKRCAIVTNLILDRGDYAIKIGHWRKGHFTCQQIRIIGALTSDREGRLLARGKWIQVNSSRINVAVQIRIVYGYAERYRCIFRCRCHIIIGYRRIVHWIDRQVHHGHITIAIGVADLVGELVWTRVVWIRRVVNGIVCWIIWRATVVHNSRSMGRRREYKNRTIGWAIAAECIVYQYDKISSWRVFCQSKYPII